MIMCFFIFRIKHLDQVPEKFKGKITNHVVYVLGSGPYCCLRVSAVQSSSPARVSPTSASSRARTTRRRSFG